MRPFLAGFTLTLAALAQSPSPRPRFDEFEVASIKPTPSEFNAGRWIRMQSLNQFTARNHTLKTLIAAAYSLNPREIYGGPAWADSDPFDITAKTPNSVRPTLAEQMAMLRKLLAGRFQLTFHREKKDLSYYALTVARGGPKLKETTISPDAAPAGPPPLIFVVSPQLIRLPGRSATMAELAAVMQRAALDHPIVDRTGLSARYDFDLEWTPDDTQFGGAFPRPAEDTGKPDLFSALQQQLGLRLEATRGPIDVLVIDTVQRPSEN